eukprot:9147281-Prorocentrum_lima.AAC.1
MYSAAGVLWDTHVWRFEEALIIARVFGPVANKVTPEVLRVVRMQPAKSASAYKVSCSDEAGSPDHDTCLRDRVELI